MSRIKIKLNGKETELSENSTVKDLLEFIENKSSMFVIEKNLEIVPKDHYGTCLLQDGDLIEIVSFVGGG